MATYSRGQIEQALWKVFDRTGAVSAPEVFQERIKGLLDDDRYDAAKTEELAFFDERPAPQIGILLSTFNVFCLAVALELMDGGFERQDVIYLFRSAKDEFRFHYRLLGHGLEPGSPRLAPLFLVAGRCGMSETFPLHPLYTKRASPARLKRQRSAVIFQPKFFRGFRNLHRHLKRDLGVTTRKVLILELTALSRHMIKELADAPPVRRGPKK